MKMELKLVVDDQEIDLPNDLPCFEFEEMLELTVKELGRNTTFHLKMKPTAEVARKLLVYSLLLDLLREFGLNPDDELVAKWARKCAFGE